MLWVEAKEAAETLEDVFTEEGDAAVIAERSANGWMVRLSGRHSDPTEWVPITRLTTAKRR